jgi:hypothetical protein
MVGHRDAKASQSAADLADDRRDLRSANMLTISRLRRSRRMSSSSSSGESHGGCADHNKGDHQADQHPSQSDSGFPEEDFREAATW